MKRVSDELPNNKRIRSEHMPLTQLTAGDWDEIADDLYPVNGRFNCAGDYVVFNADGPITKWKNNGNVRT